MTAIPVHEMIDLNFKSKQEIYDLRKSFVATYPQFIDSNYEPSPDIFSQIQDGKPWWGILGRSYYGNTEHSIDGPAEESRFITNPLLLVGLDTGYAAIIKNAHFDPTPVYPIPLSLEWSSDHKQAVVKYDVTSYRQQARQIGDPTAAKNMLTLIAYNARDLGLHYLYISPAESKNVASAPHAVEILQFIHTGGRCGYPGGCNNMSPHQEELVIKVDELPARAYIKLWKNEPQDVSAPADLVYVIDMI